MDQSQVKNHIQRFLEGKLSDAQERELLAWVKQSEENRMFFLNQQYSLEESAGKKLNPETREAWKELYRRLVSRKTQTPVYVLQNWYKVAVGIAAAFVIGFVVSLLITGSGPVPFFQPVVQQKISTPYGARTSFLLPDSSVVWLNSGSELEFPSRFGKNRPVTLTGEAYFKVKKGKIPFVVSTPYGKVEVKGTSFNVKAFTDEGFATTLESGLVNVYAQNGKGTALRPGHQAVLTENGFKVKQVETAIFTSWTEGKLIFRQEYLPEVARRLERWYNVKIILANNPQLRKIHYTGTLEMESFSEVLNLLAATAPVTYTWDEKSRTIKIFYKNKR